MAISSLIPSIQNRPMPLPDFWGAWQDYYEQIHNTQPRHQPSRQSWQFRNVAPYLSALPFTASAPSLVREGQRVWQNFQQGKMPAVAQGVGRMGKAVADSTHSSQSLSDGQKEIAMAYDNYQRGRMQALFKENEAAHEQYSFSSQNNVEDSLHTQKYKDQMVILAFKTMIRHQQLSSRIIANI